MIEVREVLRLLGEGLPKKRISAQLGLDPTVRRYLTAAQSAGVLVTATISDEEVRQVLLALHPAGGRPRGDGWGLCADHRAAIERWLGDGLRLTKIRKLLVRQGVESRIPRCVALPSSSSSLGKRRRQSRCWMGSPARIMVSATLWKVAAAIETARRNRSRTRVGGFA